MIEQVPPEERPSVSVVVRCFNEEEHIGRLLTGILEQTIRNPEIVVVDSGSTDATLSIVERYPARVVRIRPEDFSFGRALNKGFAEARGDVVVAASAHVYPVYSDWLEQLVQPFQDDQVALVYGKQRGDERTRYSEHRVFSTWFPDQSDLDQQHPFCNNANAAVRRSVWEGMPYDETLTGLEDLDWAKRVQAAGQRIVYVASAEVVHVHEEPARGIYNRYRREAMALARIQPEVRFGLGGFVRLTVSNVLNDLMHAYQEGRLWASLPDVVVFRTMQFWGSYRGFAQPGSVTRELKRRFYYPRGWPERDPRSSDSLRGERTLIDYSRSPRTGPSND